MKKRIALLIGPFLFATTPFALAQHGAGTHFPAAGHQPSMADSQRVVMMRANEEQRLAFGECAKVGESVRKLVDQMAGPGTRWRYDGKIFPGQKERLQVALAEMAAGHRQFREVLSDAQTKELEKRLAVLEYLQNDMSLWMSRLDGELMVDKPDPRHVYADTHKIKEIASKWRSEHKKIAKEMSIRE